MIRDATVSRFQDWMTSPIIRQVTEKWGPPTLAQRFISVKAVKSAAIILQYLESMGQHPELKDSPNLAADTASAQNTIFLGSLDQYAEGERVGQILERTNFYERASEPSVVVNRNPAPGEESEYREVDFSVEHKVLPAVVTLLPVTSNGTRSLMLLGATSAILTSILVTPDGLKLLDEQWKKAGFPDSWEMVIQAETNGETILRFQALAIRSVPANFWK